MDERIKDLLDYLSKNNLTVESMSFKNKKLILQLELKENVKVKKENNNNSYISSDFLFQTTRDQQMRTDPKLMEYQAYLKALPVYVPTKEEIIQQEERRIELEKRNRKLTKEEEMAVKEQMLGMLSELAMSKGKRK